MAVDHGDFPITWAAIRREITRLAKATLQNASIGRAGLRIYDAGRLVLEGGGGVQIDDDGFIVINGDLSGDGDFSWQGPWDLQGDGDIGGDVNVTGALDVMNRISLGPSGYFEAGTVRVDRFGSHGGRIASTGSVLSLTAGASVIVNDAILVAGETSLGATTVMTLDTQGAKNFKMPHPTKPDHWLRHGSTESPVSGVEYWGELTLPETGEMTVVLPEYFEALTKQENRAVLVTSRGFVADWGDIEDGKFSVSGKPHGRFSWLVKAERRGGDFLLEEPVYGPLRESAN